MNIENLQKMVELLKTIEPKNFDMGLYRNECGTVCCIVGHAQQEFDPNFELLPEADRPESIVKLLDGWGAIPVFCDWSKIFFGIGKTKVVETDHTWNYLFHNIWEADNETNTPQHAIKRIEKIIGGYKPVDVKYEFQKEAGYIPEDYGI